MTARDALGLACVLWPGLRVPVALVDALGELAPRVRLEDGGRVWIGDDWTIGHGLDWRAWGVGAQVRVPDPEDGDHVASVTVHLGPVGAQLEYLGPRTGDDDLAAPSWWAGAA